MNRFYRIADVDICLSYKDDAILKDLPEFDIFQISSVTVPDMHITMVEGEPLLPKGEHFHSIETEVANSLFYQSSAGLELVMEQNDGAAMYLFCPEGKKEAMIRGKMLPVLLRFALWTAFNAIGSIHCGVVAIHSSSIVYGDKAYIFLGESGTGKSTHTRLICSNYSEAELLNDDSPILKIDGGICRVYGSPWSGKTVCYRNVCYPLGGIVRLHQAKENEIIVLPLLQAIGALLPSLPPELYLCSRFRSAIFGMLSSITSSHPIHSLRCLPDKAAAHLSMDTLTGQ